MRKLTDEELSRVLSMEAIGKLRHWPWCSTDDSRQRGCGCVAGSAEALGEWNGNEITKDMIEISQAVGGFRTDHYRSDGTEGYKAKGPDAVLRMLEEAGLA